MNVLMYVMTMLMLLASLTYARLESFRALAGLEASFNYYMASIERIPLDLLNNNMYDQIIIRSNSSGERLSPNSASPRLSLYVLLKKEGRDKNQVAYQQIRELTKQLMITLYANQEPFQELITKQPTVLNEILDEIVTAADKNEELKIKNATVLSKLEFMNKELHYYFYLMLHGLPKVIENKTPTAHRSEDFFIDSPASEANPGTDDEVIAKEMSEEASSLAGYDSLIDYLTVKNTTKVRVFLASKTLLMAIYGSEDIVESILLARQKLYRQVKNNPKEKEQASEQFRVNFSQQGNASIYSEILDFSVTGTDPKKYE